MPSKPYIANNDVNSIIEKYWSNRDVKTTTPIFSHKMNLLQKELIEHYYPSMNDESRARANKSLKMLNTKINEYTNIQADLNINKSETLNVDVSFSEEVATKMIEVLDSTLLTNKPKSIRSRGLGGRSTTTMSDVP